MIATTKKARKGACERGGTSKFDNFRDSCEHFGKPSRLKYKTDIGPEHVLMSWTVRHSAWVVNNFQVKGSGRTPYRSLRGKDNIGEVVPFGEVCLGRNLSEDGAKLNARWMRGVFVGKLDRTDEFLLLAPAGAAKTRCVIRLDGDSAWDLQFLNLCVGSPWSVTAKSTPQGPTIQPKEELASGRRAKRLDIHQSIRDTYGRTRGCPCCVEIGPHMEDCRARIEKEMLAKGDAIKLETRQEQENPREPEASPKKRKTGESDINPGGASSLAADTSKRGESEHASNVESSTLLSAVNEFFCDTSVMTALHKLESFQKMH